MRRLGLALLVAAGLLLAVGCSSDGESVGEAAEGAAESVGDAASSLGDDGGDSGDGGDTTINIGGSDSGESGESEQLPDWAIALLVAVAVLAVIGVILGFQNRSSQKTSEATDDAYRQGRQDSTSSDTT